MEDYPPPVDAINFEAPPEGTIPPTIDDPTSLDPLQPSEATPTTTAPGSSAPPSTGRPSAKSKPPPAPLVCQVEGCAASLEGLKDYHQRYKICDVHLKIPSVERNGAIVRFCQRCGHFQPIEDFDGKKRSCRAQLQRHNARRRKRQREEEPQIDAPTALGLSAGLNASELSAMQECMQFASATLMHSIAGQGNATTTAAAATPGSEAAEAAAGAAIAGMPFGGGVTIMPYVPSRQVMALLLKGYAGMFHYSIDSIQLRPKQPVTPIADLAIPMEAAAAAAAAAMAASGVPGAVPLPAGAGAGVAGELVSHLLAGTPPLQMQLQGVAEGAGNGGSDEGAAAATAAAAAAAAASTGIHGFAMHENGVDVVHMTPAEVFAQGQMLAAAAAAAAGVEAAPHEAPPADAEHQDAPLQ